MSVVERFSDRVACAVCGQPIRGRRSNAKYCGKTCYQKHLMRRWRRWNPNPSLQSGTIGAMAELIVATDLLKRGYEVFRALSPAASCDLAVLKDGKLLRVEVRSGYKYGSSDKVIGNRHHRADILAMWVGHEQLIRYEPELF
jgi:hypothetical protein